MTGTVDEILARLRDRWPDWHLWVVYRAVGGIIWCAQRWDGDGPLIHEDDPAGLLRALMQAT
jgi:hypothetical protein